uniref:Uncharacterized protein n=1 Tax=Anguilla anguilla TaxID=7936 RepID=A0A0E9Q601_ANGAN
MPFIFKVIYIVDCTCPFFYSFLAAIFVPPLPHSYMRKILVTHLISHSIKYIV